MIGAMQKNRSKANATLIDAENGIDKDRLAGKIKEWGVELGFASIGIARRGFRCRPRGYCAGLNKGATARWIIWPKCRSAIAAAPARARNNLRDYRTNGVLAAGERKRGDTRRLRAGCYVSRYALGRDYHKTMRTRLRHQASESGKELSASGYALPFDFRVFRLGPGQRSIFRAPSRYRLAWKAYARANRQGSWHFLGEIYISIDLPRTPPQKSLRQLHALY